MTHKKGRALTSDTPVLLYGYGGFSISLVPRFSKRFLAWMNQGGVFALANLRGGSEYGKNWHEQGMLLNKQNVFDDFAYAAKFLHSKKIGSPHSTAKWSGCARARAPDPPRDARQSQTECQSTTARAATPGPTR